MPAAQTIIRRNFAVEILTPTPRRWTPYRGLASNGSHGLIIGGNFYATRAIDLPAFSEEDTAAPPMLSIQIHNGDNQATDLVSNVANRRAVITIYEVKFDVAWAITSNPAWFIGETGQPQFQGELVIIECRAALGRTGPSPSRKSKTLMTSHVPPAAGSKSAWYTGG